MLDTDLEQESVEWLDLMEYRKTPEPERLSVVSKKWGEIKSGADA
jgi:hypothetical protein